MTNNAGTWMIAGLIVGALVIAAFWITWFRQAARRIVAPGRLPGARAPFAFPDTILALVLVAAAVLLVLEEPLGESLALVAGGMLTFLGIDLAYFGARDVRPRARGRGQPGDRPGGAGRRGVPDRALCVR